MYSLLYPSVPNGTLPAIPPKTLMKHVQQNCNALNIGPLKMLSKHLKNNDLTQQLEEYEHTLSDEVKKTTWDSLVNVISPPAYKIICMLAKMKRQTAPQ